MPTKTKAEKSKVGNAGCVLCGLRASSKNVAIRSIFPIWDVENDYNLQMLENAVKVTSKDGNDYFGIATYVHEKDRAEGKTDSWVFVQWLKEVVRVDPELESLEKLLCAHQWRQDRGTATV